MGEEHRVEGRQQPRRRRGVLPRPGGLGEVEELAAGLVAQDDELVPQPVDDGPEPRQARPRLHVGGGGGAERRQVVADGGLAVGPRGRRRAEPVLGQGERGRARERPAVVRGDHHEGQPHPHRVAEGTHVGVREPLREGVAQLVERVRALLQERAGGGQHRVDVQRGAARLEDRPQRTLQHRVDHRPLGAEGGRAHQVERGALQRRADDLAVGQRASEVRGREPVQARPQRGEGRPRLLRLQPAEAVDRLGDPEAGRAGEQQLPGERGPTERPAGHDVAAHGTRSSTAASAAASTASGGPAASSTLIRAGSAAASAS